MLVRSNRLDFKRSFVLLGESGVLTALVTAASAAWVACLSILTYLHPLLLAEKLLNLWPQKIALIQEELCNTVYFHSSEADQAVPAGNVFRWSMGHASLPPSVNAAMSKGAAAPSAWLQSTRLDAWLRDKCVVTDWERACFS